MKAKKWENWVIVTRMRMESIAVLGWADGGLDSAERDSAEEVPLGRHFLLDRCDGWSTVLARAETGCLALQLMQWEAAEAAVGS